MSDGAERVGEHHIAGSHASEDLLIVEYDDGDRTITRPNGNEGIVVEDGQRDRVAEILQTP